MAGYEIEQVTDLDAVWPELVALFLEFEDYNSTFLSRHLRDDWQQRWYEHLELHEDRLILIAWASERAAGYLTASISRDYGLFDEVTAHVSDAFVRREYRGDALGRRLLRRTEEWCTSRGVSELNLEVYAANKPAVRFWTLSGFGLDSMAMKKKLRGGG